MAAKTRSQDAFNRIRKRQMPTWTGKDQQEGAPALAEMRDLVW